MHGPRLTQDAVVRSSSAVGAWQWQMLAANLLVGAAAGAVAASMRLNLNLPGHRALFWLPAVIAGRLMARHRLGATAAASAAACVSLAMGRNLAGGPLFLPLISAAGALIDTLAGFVERRPIPLWLIVPLMGLGGLGANLICSIKRLLMPPGAVRAVFGLPFPVGNMASYAVFGLLAGLGGALVAVLAMKAKARSAQDDQD